MEEDMTGIKADNIGEPEGPEEIDDVTEYILNQDQMDAIENMLSWYGQMMMGYIASILRMPRGPEKSEQAERIGEIESAMMEVARTLFPEKHAEAVAAKQRYMGSQGFN